MFGLSFLWLKLAKWAALVGALLAGLFAIWKTGKTSGAAKEQVKAAEAKTQVNEAIAVREIERTQAEAQKTVSTVEAANDAGKNIDALDDNAVREQLRNRWTRPAP